MSLTSLARSAGLLVVFASALGPLVACGQENATPATADAGEDGDNPWEGLQGDAAWLGDGSGSGATSGTLWPGPCRHERRYAADYDVVAEVGEYFYDENHRLTRVVISDVTEPDSWFHGLNSTYRYVYDEQGNVTRSVRSVPSQPCDMLIDNTTYADGVAVRIETIFGCSPTWDRTLHYNDRGLLEYERYEPMAEGEAALWRRWEYDDADRPLSWVESVWPDETPLTTKTWAWRGNGHYYDAWVDDGVDGTIEYEESWELIVDSGGRREKVIILQFGYHVYTRSKTFDSAGNLLRVDNETRDTGSYEQRYEYGCWLEGGP